MGQPSAAWLMGVGAGLLTLATTSYCVRRAALEDYLLHWVRYASRRIPTRDLHATWGPELKVACQLAISCGRAILSSATSIQHVDWKDKSGIDPCTATDRDNERRVFDGLRSAFPHHTVLGEEMCSATGKIPALENGRPTWIVDPIDGTQNFIHSLPCSVVSLGLTIDGRSVLGIVYDPHRDELYVAARQCGAFLNGRRLLVGTPATTSLTSALVLIDPGYERSESGIPKLVKLYEALLRSNTQAIRSLGSTVLSLCWVAASRASAFVIGLADGDAPKPWDWAAASLIAEEAGCFLKALDTRRMPPSRATSDDFDLFSKSIVCAHDRGLVNQLQALAKEARNERA